MKVRLLHQELQVDDRPIPLAQAYCLYQRDPFPGTSHYRLALHLATPALPFEHLARLPQGRWIAPDIQEGRALLSDIQWLIGPIATASGLARPQEITEYLYFLNSIARVLIEGQTITVEGVASPVAKSGQQHPEVMSRR